MDTENQTNQQPNQFTPQQPEISNHLVLGILTTIFCCLPFGIVSIIYAAQVNGAIQSRDYQRAKTLSDKAKFWGFLAMGIGLVFSILYTLLMVLGVFAEAALVGY